MLRYALFPALFSLVCAFAADRRPMPSSVTLSQAVEMALTSSPQLRRADAAYRNGLGEHGLARAENLPNISLVAGQSVRTLNLRAHGFDSETFQGREGIPVPERFGPFGTFDSRFVVSGDVLNLSSRFLQRAARQQATAGKSDVENARELITLQVVGHYIEALRFQALAATGHEQLAAARALSTITTDRFEQGIASGLDRRRARRQVTSGQQAVYEAEAALEEAKLRLANLVQAELTADYELTDVHRFFQPESVVASDVLRAAMEKRPDYIAAKSRVESAKMNVRAALSARLPHLEFYADLGQSGRTVATTKTTYTVQGSVVVPLYFGGRASAGKTRADASLMEAEASLDAIRSEVEMEVRIALSGINYSRLEVEAADETVSIAEEEVDLTMTRFQSGISDNSDVVLAQERLARAKQDRIRALYNRNLARAALHRSAGDAEKTYRKPK